MAGKEYIITNEVTARAGIENITRDINAELRKIEGLTMEGLYVGALKVNALSKKRVPVEHGELRNSAYIRRDDKQKTIEVGFSAPHAVHVHENLEQKWKGRPRASGLGVYWGPAGEPKFLELSFTELKDEIIKGAAKRAGGSKS